MKSFKKPFEDRGKQFTSQTRTNAPRQPAHNLFKSAVSANKPSSIQRRSGRSAPDLPVRSKTPPKAPPVYNPQQVPKALQTKKAGDQTRGSSLAQKNTPRTIAIPKSPSSSIQAKSPASGPVQFRTDRQVTPPVAKISKGSANRPAQLQTTLQAMVKTAVLAASRQKHRIKHTSSVGSIARPIVQRRLPEALRRSSAKGAIQAKFALDNSFTDSEKAKQAWRLFESIIKNHNGTRWLDESDDVTITFEVGKLDSALGATVKTLVFGEHGLQMHNMLDKTVDTGSGWKTVKLADLKNRKVSISVTLEPKFIEDNPPHLIAKTIAHEVGTHIIPYIDIFQRATTDVGLTMEDVDLLGTKSIGKGAGDHIDIRNRSHSYYENIVRDMASGLSQSEATALVFGYVIDISRYDNKGMPMKDADAIKARVLGNLDSIGWAQKYVTEEYVNRWFQDKFPRVPTTGNQQSVFTARNMASAVVVACVAAAAYYFRQQIMAFAGQFY